MLLNSCELEIKLASVSLETVFLLKMNYGCSLQHVKLKAKKRLHREHFRLNAITLKYLVERRNIRLTLHKYEHIGLISRQCRSYTRTKN